MCLSSTPISAPFKPDETIAQTRLRARSDLPLCPFFLAVMSALTCRYVLSFFPSCLFVFAVMQVRLCHDFRCRYVWNPFWGGAVSDELGMDGCGFGWKDGISSRYSCFRAVYFLKNHKKHTRCCRKVGFCCVLVYKGIAV